jgi:hypothetical protein
MSERGSTAFVWPYDPDVREVAFEVESHGKIIRVSPETDRFWWARIDPSCQNEPGWRSAAIELLADDFEPTSDIELWIRAPRSSSATAFLGFDRSDRRNIGTAGSDGTRIIRLHEYSEAPELRRIGIRALNLWICDGETENDTELARVKVFKKCPWCAIYGADPEELTAHLLAEHHDQLFERLVLRGEGVSSPTDRKGRFVCLECGEAYLESPLRDENPITLLNLHSNSRHGGRMSYKKVDSPHDLPGGKEKWIWKCKLDSNHAVIPPPDDEGALSDKTTHLKEHIFDLFNHL